MKNSTNKSPTAKQKKQNQEGTNKEDLKLTNPYLQKTKTALSYIRKNFHPTKKDKTFLIFFIFLLLATVTINIINRLPSSSKMTTINLNGHNYKVLTATTVEQQQRGLMNIHKPVSYNGMLFIFPEVSIQNFWNKNTHVDLTIYWLKNNQIVGTTDLPSVDRSGPVTVISPQPVDKVVEIIK